MNQLSDKRLLLFRLVGCLATLGTWGCSCVSHSPAQDARGGKRDKVDGAYSDSSVTAPSVDPVYERPRSWLLQGGAPPASTDAVAPKPDPPISSIPSLPKPGAGDTPVNSGAGDATPLDGPRRAWPPYDTPK